MPRKRHLIIIAVAAAALMVAGAAIALFVSSKQTADSSFTAASVGAVNIGNAETTPLFNLTDMDPGDSQTTCFVASVDNSGVAAGDWRLYSGGVTGTGLADYLRITLNLENPTTFGTPGITDCSGFTRDSTPVSLETLSSYATSTGSYAAGDNLGSQTPGGLTTVEIQIIIDLPNTPDVQNNASGLTATTSWIVENQ
jgi:hypothetical protein